MVKIFSGRAEDSRPFLPLNAEHVNLHLKWLERSPAA
jgi:hypothetical protein